MNILLVGSGAREHTIARAIKRSPQETQLFCFGSAKNPGIEALSTGYTVGTLTDTKEVIHYATTQKIDWAIIGPENPLEAGIVDALKAVHIGAVGPTKSLARLESSKSFTRQLLVDYAIPAYPRFQYFTSLSGVKEFLQELEGNYVIKADGLMGGKGVKVAGDHLTTTEDGLAWCKELIQQQKNFLIEEKLVGEEFSLMSFCDGTNVVHMPAAQDHKRAFAHDQGPNTGGMGSYSDANHSLPFLTEKDITDAHAITEAVVQALKDRCGEDYKGILYGGFMALADGIKLIEYNARFADPETMNALPLLESDFVALCQAIIEGTLTRNHAIFARKATVCKYAVPEGYPDKPAKGQTIDVSAVINPDQLYYGAVDVTLNGSLIETGSRTVAVVGIGSTIEEAEIQAENEIQKIKGPLFHREDIGTKELLRKRIEHMQKLRNFPPL